jgi:hypothetical protein
MKWLKSNVRKRYYSNLVLDLGQLSIFVPLAYSKRKARKPDPATWWDDHRPPEQRRVILFVHGFNNDTDDARKSFAHFQDRLALWSEGAADDVCWVYWAGDAAGPLSILSPLIFPQSVGQALETGPRLATAIRALRGPGKTPCEVALVGHSLGCRVILEALLDLQRERTDNIITLAFLMAAAVPVDRINGRFADVLHGPRRIPRRVVVLHSDEDAVLQMAFRLGHALGPDPAPFAEAVGLHGAPRASWDAHQYMLNYGHSSYWKDMPCGVESPVAGRLARELEAEFIRDDRMAAASVAPAERSLATRVINDRCPVEERTIPGRRVA